jgi:N-acylneuraminate cytidylyltransferase
MARFVTGRTLFIIPARGGSRRMPGKNLESIAGIPLIGWGIRIARAAARPGDLIICSTDDEQIAASARDWGAEVLDRPAELATDEATSLSVA